MIGARRPGAHHRDHRQRRRWFLLCAASMVAVRAPAAPGLPVERYDADLCATAQRILVGQPDIPVRVQTGTGNGFYTIQMSIDEPSRTLVVAMTTSVVERAGRDSPAWVGCKMVSSARVADVLGIGNEGPERSCRDVNEHTFQLALSRLTAMERDKLAAARARLEFAPDTMLPTGGEWLPADPRDGIATLPDGGYRVSALSVAVPWSPGERAFFQGTRHCKLLTLATVESWLQAAIAGRQQELLPAAKRACSPPSPLRSRVGSCLFWFAPVGGLVCQDYSGGDWTREKAQQECGRRHASQAALAAAGQRYQGAGGTWADGSCESRDDAPPRLGTCVFRCADGDETLWHLPGSDADAGGQAPGAARFCEAYVPAVR
jgi:hypothetical protein